MSSNGSFQPDDRTQRTKLLENECSRLRNVVAYWLDLAGKRLKSYDDMRAERDMWRTRALAAEARIEPSKPIVEAPQPSAMPLNALRHGGGKFRFQPLTEE